MMHAERCPVCGGSGKLVVSTDTTTTVPLTVTCHGCGGCGGRCWVEVQDMEDVPLGQAISWFPMELPKNVIVN